jgi:hypothetical protein
MKDQPAKPELLASQSVGATLRAAREAKGATLAQAELATRIRGRYLQALEADNWPALPESLYTKGFLRNYARYLGLDAQRLLSLYEQQQATPPSKPDVRPALRPMSGPGSLWAGLLTGVVVFLVFAAVLIYLYQQYTAAALPPTPVAILVIPTAAPTPTSTPIPLLEVTVPDLVGRGLATVDQDLRALGLAVVVTDRRTDTKWGAGLVITQSAPAGVKIRQGGTISVVLSTGRPGVSVPNVVNIGFDQAKGILTNAGFQVQRQDAASDQAPAGVVFRQDPAPLTAAVAGSTVIVYVSQTSPTTGKITVPNVVGMQWGDAEKVLKAAGLAIRSVNMQSFETVPQGAVLSTSPQAGAQVDPGSSIDIAVRR